MYYVKYFMGTLCVIYFMLLIWGSSISHRSKVCTTVQ